MRRTKDQGPRTLLLLLALLAVGGCGERRELGHLTVGVEAFPTNLDPRVGNDLASANVHILLYNGLLRQDERMELVPDLAERWEALTPTQYRFYLRQGVAFHDGSPLTAEDVVFTYRSMIDPAFRSSKKSGYQVLKSVEALDESTVQFDLNEPFAPFLSNLTLGIVPARLVREHPGQLKDQPVGTGPFRLKSLIWDEVLEVESWAAGGKLKRLTYRVIPSATVRALELRKGSIQLLCNALPFESLERFRQDPRFTVLEAPGTKYKYLGFNLEDPVLKHQGVRKALAHAVDRTRIITNLLDGMAEPASSLLSPQNWAYTGDLPRYDFNLPLAGRLLDQAGFSDPDGEGPQPRFSLEFKASEDKTANKVAEVMQEAFRRIGIAMDIRSYEWATFYADIQKGNFQLFSLKWVGISDPDIYYTLFHSSSVPPNGANRGKYRNAELDRLLEEARRNPDRAERKRLYGVVQRLLADDLPYVSLWYEENVAVLRKEVKGFVLYPNGGLDSLAQAGTGIKLPG